MIGFLLDLQVWLSGLAPWCAEHDAPLIYLSIPHKVICGIDPIKENQVSIIWDLYFQSFSSVNPSSPITMPSWWKTLRILYSDVPNNTGMSYVNNAGSIQTSYFQISRSWLWDGLNVSSSSFPSSVFYNHCHYNQIRVNYDTTQVAITRGRLPHVFWFPGSNLAQAPWCKFGPGNQKLTSHPCSGRHPPPRLFFF